jgi:hypothetical protein
MEDFNKSAAVPLFKKLDREIFSRIDKFKLSPSYNNLQDFYNGFDEEQQKVLKAAVILAIFVLPLLFLGLVFWQNNALRADMETRIALIAKANEILGQRRSLEQVAPAVLSDGPIDGESMMSSRLANLLAGAGVDLSKIQVRNYTGDMASGTIMRAEADFQFTNLSTDELTNVFSNMITREKFRIQSVTITRNPDTNLLQGQFHAIHFGNAQNTQEE